MSPRRRAEALRRAVLKVARLRGRRMLGEVVLDAITWNV